MESVQDYRNELRKKADQMLQLKAGDKYNLSELVGKSIGVLTREDPVFTIITSIHSYHTEWEHTAGEPKIDSLFIEIQTAHNNLSFVKEGPPQERIYTMSEILRLRLIFFRKDGEIEHRIQTIFTWPNRTPSWHKTEVLMKKNPPAETGTQWRFL